MEINPKDILLVKCQVKSLFSGWIDSVSEFEVEEVFENSIRGYFDGYGAPTYKLKTEVIEKLSSSTKK